MNAARKDPEFLAGLPMAEIVETVRSEPAISWFLAQALWIAQPALEAFWPQEKIAALAEMLESPLELKQPPAQGIADGGEGK